MDAEQRSTFEPSTLAAVQCLNRAAFMHAYLVAVLAAKGRIFMRKLERTTTETYPLKPAPRTELRAKPYHP
eukprot:3631168-Amphidinium_carterae.1